MFITVTSPIKGMGQTITAINFGAQFASSHEQPVNIIDMNKYCRDIEYYLSDTTITKGLDDFVSLRNINRLEKSLFSNCLRRVNKNIHIMAANNYLEMDPSDLDMLAEYSKSLYNLTVVDSIGGKNGLTRQLLKLSDTILVVLNQCKRALDRVAENEQYLQEQDKVVFIVNRYMCEHDKEKVDYGIREIESDLNKLGFKNNKVFPLTFDAEVLNECNDRSVLNFVLSRQAAHRLYNQQIIAIVDHVTEGLSNKEAYKAKPEKSVKDLRLGKLFG